MALSTASTYQLRSKAHGSFLTNDMFEDVDPKEFQNLLNKGEAKEEGLDVQSKGRAGAPDDGVVQAKAETFDPATWNDTKKNDCYFRGLNNIVSDGLLHLADGTCIDCETGRKANEADY